MKTTPIYKMLTGAALLAFAGALRLAPSAFRVMTPCFLPLTLSVFPLLPAQLLAGRSLFSLIVKGSIVGLTAATASIPP